MGPVKHSSDDFVKIVNQASQFTVTWEVPGSRSGHCSETNLLDSRKMQSTVEDLSLLTARGIHRVSKHVITPGNEQLIHILSSPTYIRDLLIKFNQMELVPFIIKNNKPLWTRRVEIAGHISCHAICSALTTSHLADVCELFRRVCTPILIHFKFHNITCS